MFDRDLTLKDRMKEYQDKRNYKLPPDSYVIAHIDGRAFSKMIKKKFRLPFDDDFIRMMDDTAAYVCENVQGAKLAYVQSDEISLIISAYSYNEGQLKLGSPFFDFRLCKMQSIIASLATAKFNQLFALYRLSADSDKGFCQQLEEMPLVQFDCKCWDVPSYDEAYNWLKFRQNDCIRNSKQQFAQTYCPHKELLNKNADEQVTYCKLKTDRDWNAIDVKYKYGRIVYRSTYPTQVLNPKTGEKVNVIRSQYSSWLIDSPFDYDWFVTLDLVPKV